MADVFITLKVMPSAPDSNLDKITKAVETIITKFPGKVTEKSIEPIAFGLKAVIMTFATNEKNSNLDPLEEEIKNLDNVNSCEVTEVRRVVG